MQVSESHSEGVGKMPGENNTLSSILYIHAITALHPGSGHALGVVDLPVQRERHTQWPLIPASSIKGVLRDACRNAIEGKPAKEADDDPAVVAAFGPTTSSESKHAGALMLTDARLLAFPVRSLKGVFAWVTCPAVLERLNRDLKLAGKAPLAEVAKLQAALGNADKMLAVASRRENLALGAGDTQRIVLEEFEFKPVSEALSDPVIRAVQAASDEASRSRVATNLVAVHDDNFGHFVRHATEVTARIALGYETKTAKDGALFYQEFLPAETLFYSVVIANPSRAGKGGGSTEILNTLRSGIQKQKGMLQFGGNETIGRGFCTVALGS